jgi:hypothetical protein
MDETTILRYQVGGDLYNDYLAEYGQSSADAIAAAAETGVQVNVTNAIATAQYGAPLDTSTLGLLGSQLATDPLAAPEADASSLWSGITSFVGGLDTTAWFIIAALGLIAIIYFTSFLKKFKK